MTKDADCSRIAGALRGTPYRAMELLGRGSSSNVYKAVGPSGEVRAVKILRPAPPSSRGAALQALGEEAAKLTRESHVLAALHHHHIVRVFDTGVTTDGRPYIVMERLTGETLRDALSREGRLPPARACSVLAGALDALDAAHRAGVVHCDVKPSNIFLCRTEDLAAPRAVLLDFGLAEVEGARKDQAASSHVIGTPRYVAPEQILDGHIDARTDVYAMGLVLFEAIAGRSPYDAADEASSIRAHLCDKPYSLRRFAKVAPDLERAVARALCKEPDKRWPSAGAFAAALARAVAPSQSGESCRHTWSRA